MSQLAPIEKWLYFLQHAEHMDPEELAAKLVDDEFLESVRVLAMISRSPEERMFYAARMTFLRDEEARLVAARHI